MDLIIGLGFSLPSGPRSESKSVSFTHHLLIVGLEMKVACVEHLLEVKVLVAWLHCMFIILTRPCIFARDIEQCGHSHLIIAHIRHQRLS